MKSLLRLLYRELTYIIFPAFFIINLPRKLLFVPPSIKERLLTFTTHSENSAEDKWTGFSPRKQSITFHANCLLDNLHEKSKLFSGKPHKTYSKMTTADSFKQHVTHRQCVYMALGVIELTNYCAKELKNPYFSKIDHFYSRKVNKMMYSINTIIKCASDSL